MNCHPWPVNHRGVADALEEMNAVDDRSQQVVHIGAELGLRLRRADLVKQTIEALPLLGGDFFADLAGVFARAVHAEGHGGGIEAIEDEGVRHRIQIAVPVQALGIAKRRQQACPACFGRGAAGVEHQAHGDVELAHRVFCPLQVAAHPVEAVGNAAEHGRTLPKAKFGDY